MYYPKGYGLLLVIHSVVISIYTFRQHIAKGLSNFGRYHILKNRFNRSNVVQVLFISFDLFCYPNVIKPLICLFTEKFWHIVF